MLVIYKLSQERPRWPTTGVVNRSRSHTNVPIALIYFLHFAINSITFEDSSNDLTKDLVKIHAIIIIIHSTPCSFFSLDLDLDFGFDLDGFLSLLGFLSLFGFLSLLGFFLAEGGADLAEDGLAESGLAVRWSSAKWSLSQIWARIAVCNAYPICGRHEATRDWSSSP